MTRQELIDLIEDQTQITQEIRKEERKYKKVRSGLVNSPLELKGKMEAILPKHLVPQNIGQMSQILWPQFYEFKFSVKDIANAANIKIGANDLARIAREQITQDACFLLTAIHRDAQSATEGGIYAPLGITIRDNSSSRTLNDFPIPFTAIGLRTRPTKLPVPFLVQPNASLNVELTPLWPSDINIPNEDGVIKIVLSGYRIRPSDVNAVVKKLYL